MRFAAALISLAAAATAAYADDAVVGVSVSGAGKVTGKVTDAAGKPLAGLEVHVTTRGTPERIVTTAADGTYALEISAAPNDSSLVFVRGHREAKIEATTVRSNAGPNDEVIDVRATEPPATPAKAISDPRDIPDYSDAALDADVWARAWMLLEIDATGTVRHAKFIKRAGFDLDPIALRSAFALRFHPALDKAKHPIGTLVMWSFEWPSRSWIRELNDGMYDKIGREILTVTCQKPDKPRRSVYRDCSEPDMTRASIEAWLAPKPERH